MNFMSRKIFPKTKKLCYNYQQEGWSRVDKRLLLIVWSRVCFSLCSPSTPEVIWAQLVSDDQLGHSLKEAKTHVLVKQSKRWRCARLCGANLRQSCSRRAALSGAPRIPSNNTAREVGNAKRTAVFHYILSCQHTHPFYMGDLSFPQEPLWDELEWKHISHTGAITHIWEYCSLISEVCVCASN